MDIKDLHRLYIDTNIWIYALEGYPEYNREIQKIFSCIDEGSIEVFTSQLALAETLVKPFQENNTFLEEKYKALFSSSDNLILIPVEQDILIDAARLCAKYKIKLPDAIHLSSAMLYQCDHFLTNDKQIKTIPEINVTYLSDVKF